MQNGQVNAQNLPTQQPLNQSITQRPNNQTATQQPLNQPITQRLPEQTATQRPNNQTATQQPLNQRLPGQTATQRPNNQTATQRLPEQTATQQPLNQPNQIPQQQNQTIQQNQLNQPNQIPQQQNQFNQPNQSIQRQNQGIVGQNNSNNPLGTRQSKLSTAGIQAANEPIRQLQQPVVNPQPIQNIPQHNIQSRQSKLSVVNNERPKAVVTPIQQPVRQIGSRQSKLSLEGQQDRPRPNDLFIQNRNPPQDRRRQSVLPISRQSKLSVIDGVQQPLRQPLPRLPEQPSRRSNRSVAREKPSSKNAQRQSPIDKSFPNFQTRNRRLTPAGIQVDRAYTASTTALSTYSDYETLQFFPLVVGREDPEIFTEGIQNQGWMSEPDANYPIDVIFGLDHICNVYKVYLTVTDHLIPAKVEVRIGKKRKEDDDPTYITARSASYQLKATMRFQKRITDIEERETKVAFVDSECQYLWFLFHAPHESKLNPTNQIRITNLTIEGYQIEPKQKKRVSRSVDSFRSSLPPTRQSVPRSRRRSKQRNRTRSRGSTALSMLSYSPSIDPSIMSSRRDRDDLSDIISRDNGRASRISLIGSLGDAEDWKSTGDNLASDPLMAVRLVRNLLSKKRKRSLKRGREVEATICLRSVETLNGYEKQMADIRRKMSEALQQENVDEAKKQELALIDCRDTAFRVIHLDLLLEKTELRAIGVQSKWSPETSSLR